jgi:glutathione synthase/RimK-type ligase-like ATP-grasp enzyme
MKHSKIIGIMVSESQINPPFSQNRFLVHLSLLGVKLGFLVYVFSPLRVNDTTKSVQGYNYHSSEWSQQTFPLPDLIYDRAFFTKRQHYQRHMTALNVLQRLKKTPYLGRSLTGKWSVHKVLLKHPFISAHLPKTELLRNSSHLFHWFEEHSSVLIKPESGSHGKGVLAITKTTAAEYSLQGRNMRNQTVSKQFPNAFALRQWLMAFIGGRSYLIQRYLPLQTEEGVAYDIRVLMQKGGDGQWSQTGMATRVGELTSITSNLHGGGTATQVLPWLTKQFDGNRAQAILAKINALSALIPPFLEQHFGRLAELGLDIGVDRNGRIWVIEINSKPGRTAAHWFSDPGALDQAMSNPMLYARYLLLRSLNFGTILGG